MGLVYANIELINSGDIEVLLGAIPIIGPKDQKLKVNPLRPYVAQKSLK
jgi:hypothetical protein